MTTRIVTPCSDILHRQWVAGLACFATDLSLHCIARSGAVGTITGIPNEDALLPELDHPGRGFAVSLVTAPHQNIHLLLVNAGLMDRAHVDAWILKNGLFFHANHEGVDEAGFMPISVRTGHEILTAIKSFAHAHPGFLDPKAA